jgi:flagellar hook-length control protein FliK
METDVKPSEAKNNEGGSQNVFREIEAGVNPVETQQQNKEGGSRNSLRELESSAEPFSAEGLGQVIEVQVESEPTAETTVFATEPEKGVGFDAVDESPTGLGKSASIEFIEEIISQVKPHIKNGETSMRLKVNPEDLGAIEIQMVSNERGVTLNFVTEQASTGKLLESQSGQLRQSLKEAGVQLTNLNISQHNQPGQEGGFFRQDRQFVQPNRRSVPLTGPPNEERMRPQRIAGSTHKIDYLV